jgi:hypothetical protein
MQSPIDELLAEYRSLDRSRDTERAREILSQLAQLIDRDTEPQKWAAVRVMYAKMSSKIDPDAAIFAYEDALTVYRPETDHGYWATCQSELACLLAPRSAPGSVEAEKAIRHLELAVDDYPGFAETLACYYRYRNVGDPTENWERRVKYFERALSQTSRAEDPAAWARITK